MLWRYLLSQTAYNHWQRLKEVCRSSGRVAWCVGESDDKQVVGSAEGGIEQDTMLQNIVSQTHSTQLAQATEMDKTLTTARSLANTLSEV